MRKTTTIAMAAILTAAMFASNVNAASTQHVRTISSESAQPDQEFKRFDTTLKAFDFNGDGRKEIIAQNDNRHVYVINPQSGNILADLKTSYPDGWGARPLNSPEAAVLEHGGQPHVVVVNSASVVTLFRYDGAWGGEHHFTKVWDKRTTFCHKNPGNDAKPVLHDLDGDGDLEILIQTEEVGVYALRMDGSVLWRRCISGGNGEPAVADMDGNGIPDVVWASDNGVVTRMNGRTGNTICSFWAGAREYGLGAASMPVGPTIAQVNNRGPLDIVVGARDSSNHDDQSRNHAALFVLKGKTCELMWWAQDPQGAPLTYTHPIVYDVDRDGQQDILWADWNTVGHKPPHPDSPDAWKRTGPAHFYRYDAEGNMRWRTTLDTYWNNKDLALADVDNDGVMEVLANGPGSNGDGIWYLNSITGAKETFVSTHPWKVSRAPVIHDLYGWGTMQWIVPVEAATSQVSGGAIMIFDTGAPYNAPWPHPPGPGSASGGSGGSSGGGSGGGFDASFQVPDPANNWWVETKVDANEKVTTVTASVDGGRQRALDKTDWGTWAKSFHVSDGSQVVFTATSSSGQTDSSRSFAWGSSGGGSGGEFTATFQPSSNRNEWWVETSVDANKPVKSVEARVEDGSWKTLEKTDWGSWAKSFHVPEGSQVRFRASDGETTVTSTWYTWA